MRYLFRLLCVCALAGCGGTSADPCASLGLYDCIAQPSCTQTSGVEDRVCSAITQADCAMRAPGPAADNDRSFCKLHVHSDGAKSFYWVRDAFCNQDPDCGEGRECVQMPEFGMLRGECSDACVDECQDDTDCPQGSSCVEDIGCGGCSDFVGVCWDGLAKFCQHLP